MSENNFWQGADPGADRSWIGRGRANTARFNEAHQPALEPEPDPATPDMVAGLDLAAYAQVRDQLGMRSAGEFVGLDRRHVEDATGIERPGSASVSA